VNAQLDTAIDEFNRGDYFKAAELFEGAAPEADDNAKSLILALNRIAAGLHLRFERGGRQAAINLFSQAMLTLDEMRPAREGIDIDIEQLYKELFAYTEEIRGTPKDERDGMKHRARIFLERRRAPQIQKIKRG
jgi:tetratricopeptide (TPR) repeat protein